MAMTVSTSVDYDQQAWELRAYFALRPELYFDAVADIKPTRQSMVGSSVKFTIQNDLAVSATPLNESTDVTPQTLSDSTISVALAEYGSAIQTSALLRGTSFVPLDPIIANVIGYAAGISLDTVAEGVLEAGTNVRYSQGAPARNQVTPSDTFGAADARYVTAKLRGASVPAIGGFYVGFQHPDVSVDFRSETGAASWRDPHTYSQPGEIWQGETGVFEGIRWIETPRAPIFADAGSSTTLTDVYASLILGRQALAKTFSSTDGNGPMPRIAPGPVTDFLRRFTNMGWFWLGGYGLFRQASIYRVESASSIGT